MFKYKYINRLLSFVFLSLVSALVLPSPAAQAQTFLESPTQGSFESGIGLIRGWVCEANAIEIVIDQGTGSEKRLAAAYPSRRQDTQTACGDSDNGFGVTVNWNNIGDGLHNLRALADGTEFANVNFVVTTLGDGFRTGLGGEFPLSNFPANGNTSTLGWSEPQQNFVFKNNVTIPSVTNPPVVARTFLESPTQGSFESGIGLIRGWVCEANAIEVVIDQGTGSEKRLATAYPSRRQDTQATCGDSDNGFGVTVPWYAFDSGVHNLRALADGVEFANVNFAVTALGSTFLTGLSGDYPLNDFPSAGNSTLVRWSEPHQNFVIASSTVTGEKFATIAAITDLLNPFAAIASDPRNLSSAFGVRVDKASDGRPTRIDSIDWRDLATGVWLRLVLSADGLPSRYSDSQGLEARFSNFTGNSIDVSFFNGNGTLILGPITMPIAGDHLSPLQGLVGQLAGVNSLAESDKDLATAGVTKKFFARSTPVVLDTGQTVTRPQFSINPLLLDMIWSGGVAMEETLCALTGAGVSNLIAGSGCAAPVVAGFGNLADAPLGGSDPAVQQLVRLSRADVDSAPCSETSDDPTCLSAATEKLEEIEEPLSGGGTTFDLTGTWTGGARSTVFTGCNASLELNFVQTSDQLSGSGSATVTASSPAECGPGEMTSGQLGGTVSGNQINAGLVSNSSGSVNYSGTIADSGEMISGTYTAPSVGDSGTWQVIRESGGTTPTVPGAPTNVSASDGAYEDKVRIDWSAVTNATSYEVYRSDSSSGGGTRIGQPSTTTFEDTTVSTGVAHYYSIKACNSAGCGAFSLVDDGYRGTVALQESHWGVQANDLCCTGSSSTLSVTLDGVTRHSTRADCSTSSAGTFEGFATTTAGAKSFTASVTASACATLTFSGNVDMAGNTCYIFQSSYQTEGPVLLYGTVSCASSAAQSLKGLNATTGVKVLPGTAAQGGWKAAR